ncbi:LytR C-terminal domain-containing protein [Pseudarthrobacter sp. J75]|uniref:LytR C-terminal domain-containing protein n=1 Tax=unclassified Pseudarthrobacter TaxID=2647000 RepID=UPI002E8157C1|nr:MULTISPECIES: LytR C-terminal domain-containing protein [unclassified Pseudarthrobacter]MEE2522567.1 LytR C-terminal domain-containing protein [Pseudarthrobacter sp. J47]MEE2529088.1 LytR C-terminal domain-containing protein [Pseudarthrobacter sp. J75]
MTRKLKDPSVFHGHRVVTGPDLRATFTEPEDPADVPGRMTRRIVHGVVLVLLLALIISASLVALGIMNGHIKLPAAVNEPRTTVSLCPATTFDYVPPESVNVNVYNATNRPGLARSAADALLARKFVVAEVGNSDAPYRGVAAVISGAAGQSAAFTIQRHLPGSDYFQDARSDASVDVVLSTNYADLAAPELVDQTPGKLSCPRETRRIADPAPWPVIAPRS